MSGPLMTVPYKLRESFRRGLACSKIIFFSAGTGWGKTSVVKKLLDNQNFTYVSLRKNRLSNCFSKKPIIVIDDFQVLSPYDKSQFQNILRESSREQRFILLSRGPLPDILSLYEATNALLQLGISDLALDLDCLAQLTQTLDLSFTTQELQRLRDETDGCPAAVNILLAMLSAGQPFLQPTLDAMNWKMGAYIEESVLRLLEPDARRLLTDLSLFDQFDPALAETLSGDSNVHSILESLWQTHGLMQPCEDGWHITDERFLLPYLRKKLLAESPPARICKIHLVGGHWYAQRQDFHKALYHYKQAGSSKDIMEALAQNAHLHPGTGAYYEMRDYYNMLTKEEILSSPDMICAMSMLCSMTFEPEKSEEWYDELRKYRLRMNHRDSDCKKVEGLLAYLDIGLPHRGTAGLAEKIPAVYKLLCSKSLILPELSVTSNLPSLLRGGKDFSEWVPKDKLLYNTIRIPVEKVLGRYGVGLGEIALTESLLEKGEDISGRFLTLVSLQDDLRSKGTPEMEFVLISLLVRTLLSVGSTEKAQEILTQFRAEVVERNITRLLPNIDAMFCRISLLVDSSFSSVWFSEQAPGEGTFYGMERYRYLTKARCYIKYRKHYEALLLLGRMLDYTQRYDRPLDMLETLILVSICRYRTKNEDWQEHFTHALALGAKYSYVAVFAREGAALLPLMGSYINRSTVNATYWNRLLSSAIVYAGFYNQYLQPFDNPSSRLTQTEFMILRLICQDKSNDEICGLLNIKLPTVKTHVRSILKKLNAGSRSEARKAAERLGLI